MKTFLCIGLMALAAVGAKSVSVLEFGAIGDGATPSHAAFMEAAQRVHADGGGVVYVPDGVYVFDRTPDKYFCVGLEHLTNVVFRGQTRTGAVLRLTTTSTFPVHSDIHMFKLARCSGIGFKNLTLDGSKASHIDHDEQMHGIYILNSSGTWIRNVSLRELRGDGVYVIGDNAPSSCPEAPCFTDGVTIQSSAFVGNGRSGIANQGGTKRLNYYDNHFENNKNQDIDFEPTGTRPGPEDVNIRRNTMIKTNGDLALTLVGSPRGSPGRRFVATDNVIIGGVMIYKIRGCEFARNRVLATKRAAIIRTHTEDIYIHNNWFQSAGEFVVYAVYPTTSGVRFEHNTVVQTGTGRGIRIEGCGTGIVLRGNSVFGPANALEGISVVLLVNDHLSRPGYIVEKNSVTGFKKALVVGTSNTETRYDAMQVSNNYWMIPRAEITEGTKVAYFKNVSREDGPMDLVIDDPVYSGNVLIPY